MLELSTWLHFFFVPILRAQPKRFLVHLLMAEAEIFCLDTSIFHLLSSQESGCRHLSCRCHPDSFITHFSPLEARRLSSGLSRYAQRSYFFYPPVFQTPKKSRECSAEEYMFSSYPLHLRMLCSCVWPCG